MLRTTLGGEALSADAVALKAARSTRPVVLAWMCRNRSANHAAYLECKYPDALGDKADPRADPPDDLLNEPKYAAMMKCREILATTSDAVKNNKLEHEMLTSLLRRRDRPFNPLNI